METSIGTFTASDFELNVLQPILDSIVELKVSIDDDSTDEEEDDEDNNEEANGHKVVRVDNNKPAMEVFELLSTMIGEIKRESLEVRPEVLNRLDAVSFITFLMG